MHAMHAMQVLHLDQAAAAAALNVAPSKLREERNRFGIKRWPFRKFASLRNMLNYYKAIGRPDAVQIVQ
jgi:hypothetical protein